MSDELNAEIARLKAANDKLQKDLASSHDDLKEVRAEARDRRHENKGLTQQLESITKERDDFKVKAETDPAAWQSKLADAHAQIRTLKHDRAYEAVARDLKVTNPVKFADL